MSMQFESDGWRSGEILIAAIVAGDRDKVDALLDSGISPNQVDRIGQQPMFVASRDGKAEIAETLMRRGIDVNAPVQDGRSPLYWAAAYGHVEVVRLLLASGANIDAIDGYGQTPLLSAALSLANESLNTPDLAKWRHNEERYPKRYTAVVETLILAGADVNYSRKGAYSPAHFIREAGIPRLVSLMEPQEKPARKRSFWTDLFGRG